MKYEEYMKEFQVYLKEKKRYDQHQREVDDVPRESDYETRSGDEDVDFDKLPNIEDKECLFTTAHIKSYEENQAKSR